jgi:predicted transcriptional regulator
MTGWVYDSEQTGLFTVLKDYEVEELRFLWKKGDFGTSREVYDAANKALKTKTISRASVINSLNSLVKLGVLEYSETTGKGGHRGLYKAAMSEEKLKQHISKTLNESMKSNLF